MKLRYMELDKNARKKLLEEIQYELTKAYEYTVVNESFIKWPASWDSEKEMWDFPPVELEDNDLDAIIEKALKEECSFLKATLSLVAQRIKDQEMTIFLEELKKGIKK